MMACFFFTMRLSLIGYLKPMGPLHRMLQNLNHRASCEVVYVVTRRHPDFQKVVLTILCFSHENMFCLFYLSMSQS